MDKNIKYKISQVEKMLATLERGIALYDKKLSIYKHDDEEVLSQRDSVIKRLEYSVDSFWKLIKLHLETVQGIPLEATGTGPKPIARTAALHHVISEQESLQLIDMIEERNKTSHMYKEEIADEVAKHAPQALALMKSVVIRLKNNPIQRAHS